MKQARLKFELQKMGAISRGIEWRLSFMEWLRWWGEDLPRRGRGPDNLCMMRKLDRGPYALGNIEKGTPRQNMRTAGALRRKKNAEKAAAALEAARSRDAGKLPEPDQMTEDEQWLRQNLGMTSVWDLY